MLNQIDIQQTCFTVINNFACQIQQILVRRSSSRETPTQSHIFSIDTQHFFYNRCFNRRLMRYWQLRQIGVRFQMAKIFIDRLDHLVRIKITGQTDCHIIRDIPSFMVVFDIRDRRVLQVFLCSKNSLRSVWMIGEKSGQNSFIHFTTITGKRHVLFFVHSLKFRMKATDYIVFKTVRLYLGPVVNLVGRNIFHVDRLVKAGIRICSSCTNSRHQFIIFVRNCQFRSLIRNTVDLMINSLAFCLISSLTIHLKKLFDLIKHRFFLFVILRAELLSSFKHQVFKIVCQTGRFGRIVFTSHANGNIRLNTWGLFIHSHIHFQAVIQSIDTGFQRIVRDRLVFKRGSLCTCSCQKEKKG